MCTPVGKTEDKLFKASAGLCPLRTKYEVAWDVFSQNPCFLEFHRSRHQKMNLICPMLVEEGHLT